MGNKFTLTIDTEQFGANVASQLARALHNAAHRVEAGSFELGETYTLTIDGKPVGEYRHIATRRRRDKPVTTEPHLERAFAHLLGRRAKLAEQRDNSAEEFAPQLTALGDNPSLQAVVDLAERCGLARWGLAPRNIDFTVEFIFKDYSTHRIPLHNFNKGDRTIAIVHQLGTLGPVPLSQVIDIAVEDAGGVLSIESGNGLLNAVFRFDDGSIYQTHIEADEEATARARASET